MALLIPSSSLPLAPIILKPGAKILKISKGIARSININLFFSVNLILMAGENK
ncbi:unnamed protein product, partial [marine sediment metagenome]